MGSSAVPLNLLPGPLLCERTSLRLGGRVLAEITADENKDLDGLPRLLEKLGAKPLVLGHGSNILARDGSLAVALLRPPKGRSPRVVLEREGMVRVRADAGLPLQRLLGRIRTWGLSGMEGLAGIPGSVGGAVAMNAGAYGSETGRVLARVLVYGPKMGTAWIGKDEVRLGYRFFAPKQEEEYFMVLAAEFDLKKDAPDRVKNRMAEAYGTKKKTQPLRAASAGCVFKNPESGPAAGKLLEDAGFKGRRLGGMAFSEIHANFLVNLGDGKSAEAFELIDKAGERVASLFGQKLQLEVRVCP
ncbi:MAG: UDP-N-acetylmuramate dehydrogenase [Thermodesulfobacteriota bacterium]|nr:UDP-N-acetylmuramate dehydrogenase [Thermodesulfobacteriota bacterium]